MGVLLKVLIVISFTLFVLYIFSGWRELKQFNDDLESYQSIINKEREEKKYDDSTE